MSVIVTMTVVAMTIYVPVALSLTALFWATAPDSQSIESQLAQRDVLVYINVVYHSLLYFLFLYPYLSEGDGEGLLWMPLAYPIYAVPFLVVTLLVGHHCRSDTPITDDRIH